MIRPDMLQRDLKTYFVIMETCRMYLKLVEFIIHGRVKSTELSKKSFY